MQRVERETVIGAPPAEVFAYLSDLDKISEWQAGITDARQTSEGGMRVGATALVTRELMGQQMQAPLLVTEYEPPHRIAIDSEVSGVKVHATLDLAPTENGEATALAFAIEIRGSMLTSFMEPMIASAAGGDIEATLERIRSKFDSAA